MAHRRLIRLIAYGESAPEPRFRRPGRLHSAAIQGRPIREALGHVPDLDSANRRRLDAFSALRGYELCSPVAGELRRHTPLFTRAHGGDALRHSVVDLHLKSLLSFRVGADEAKKFSFHSHRITIACKLRACDEDWATIQALVRWRSVESASIYALTPESHSTKLSRALSVDASSVTTRHLPTIDATDFASAINLADDATMAADADGGADAGSDPQRQ